MTNSKPDKNPQGIVTTQNAAASAFKVSSKTIRAWKAEGGEAAGFRPDGTIDLGVLANWLEVRREMRDGSVSLKETKLLEEIRKLRFENDIMEGKYVERSVVRQDMDKAANKCVAVLKQKFETELPPKQDGMPTEKIAELNRKALQEVCLILSQPSAYQDLRPQAHTPNDRRA